MFGCLGRLGCAAVLLVAGALGWLTRDLWLPTVRARIDGPAAVAVADTAVWQRLTPARAERGERAVRALVRKGGPVFVSVPAGDLASYAFLSLAPALPEAFADAETAVIGDRAYVRTEVAPRDFAGALGGGLGGVLADRDTLLLGGTFEVIRPGLAQFRVREVRLGRFPIPDAVVPRLMARVRRGAAPEGVAPEGYPIELPPYIGDVRLARGRVTLYKNTP